MGLVSLLKLWRRDQGGDDIDSYIFFFFKPMMDLTKDLNSGHMLFS